MRNKMLALTLCLLALTAGARAAHVFGTISTGTGPYAAAVNPVTNMVYVADSASGTVTVFNGYGGDTATVAAGAFPCAVAVNTATDKVYVANYNGNSVTVIDGTDTATVAVSTNPCALAVNAATNRIYVANYGSGSVTVINGATNDTASIPTGSGPRALAVNPATGKVYVTNFSDSTLSVIDGAGGTVDTTLPLTANPYTVVVNPATNKVYVASYIANALIVIDGNDNTVDTTLAAGTNLCALAVNPATNKIYVARGAGNTIAIVDGATNAIAAVLVGIQPRALAVNVATNRIYVANWQTNNVHVINGDDNSKNSFTAGTNPCAIVVNPATNRAYCVNNGSNSVTLIDGDDKNYADYWWGTSITAPVRYAAVDPRNQKAYFTMGDVDTILVMDLTSHAITSFSAGDYPSYIAVNPLTGQAYVCNQNSNTVTVVDGASASVADTIRVGASPRYAVINKLTNTLYVANYNDSTVSVIDLSFPGFQINASIRVPGSPTRLLVNHAANETYVSLGSSNNLAVIDGRTLAVTPIGIGAGSADVMSLNPATNKIYVTRTNSVVEIDGAAHDTSSFAVNSPYWVLANPVNNRLYVSHSGNTWVTVIDCSTGDTTRINAMLNSTGDMALNTVTNKIYYRRISTTNIDLGIIDCASNTADTVKFTRYVLALDVDPVLDRVYCAGGLGTTQGIWDYEPAPAHATGLAATLNLPLGDTTDFDRPALSGSVSGSWTPHASQPTTVLCNGLTGQEAFNQASAGGGSYGFAWGGDSLVYGENYLVAYPVEAHLATTNNLGLGTPMVGDRLVRYICRTRDVTAPLAPIGLAPQQEAVLQSSDVAFQWTAVAKGTTVSYIIQVDTAYNFSGPLFSDTTGLTVDTLSLFEGKHYWRVIAFDGAGFQSPWSATMSFEIDATPPNVPAPIAPYANSWLPDTQVVFAWAPATKLAEGKAAPVRYVIHIDTSIAFANPLIDTVDVTLDTFNLYEGHYWWKVMAYDLAGNVGPFSNARTFGVDTTAPLVTYVKSLPDDPSAPWGPYQVTGTVYDLSGIKTAWLFVQVDGGAWDSTGMSYGADSLRTSIPEQTPAVDESLTVSYYLKVSDLVGHLAQSATYSFRAIGPTGVAGRPGGGLPKVFALQPVHPNPARGAADIHYQLPKASSVTLEIYSITGQLVKRFDEGIKQPGYYSVRWDAAGRGAGVYFYRLRAGEYQNTKKLVVIK